MLPQINAMFLRSKPSSRTFLNDEQSYPWIFLPIQDKMSRHRRLLARFTHAIYKWNTGEYMVLLNHPWINKLTSEELMLKRGKF